MPDAAPDTIATLPSNSFAPTVPSPEWLELHAGIEGVPQAVPEPVDRHDDQDDGQAGKRGQPPRRVHEGPAAAQHLAPIRRGRLDSQAEEAQRGAGHDRVGDAEGHEYDDRGEDVRQDVTEDDADIPPAGRAGGLHVLELPYGQR